MVAHFNLSRKLNRHLQSRENRHEHLKSEDTVSAKLLENKIKYEYDYACDVAGLKWKQLLSVDLAREKWKLWPCKYICVLIHWMWKPRAKVWCCQSRNLFLVKGGLCKSVAQYWKKHNYSNRQCLLNANREVDNRLFF